VRTVLALCVRIVIVAKSSVQTDLLSRRPRVL
jgi:hypothetical protein